MDYQELFQIIKKGKTLTTEFMQESNAFQGSVKDDAELARQIIALANNGNVISYLIIGVSDDGQNIQSVSNENLTDDNLQAFCMENIFPLPVVKLFRLDPTGEPVDADYEGKTMIVIQIGPQPHKCFRFNHDFVCEKDIYYFRKYEVWIRRNASASLASPEEIKRLLEGQSIVLLPTKDFTFKDVSEHIYVQSSQERFLLVILDDLGRLAKKSGGKLYYEKDPFLKDDFSLAHYIIIFVNGNPVILRLVIVDSSAKKGEIMEYNRKYVSFHNGLLLISRNVISPEATEYSEIKSKESWGWFCAGDAGEDPQTRKRNFKIPLPSNTWEKIGEPIPWNMAFSNISNFSSLKNAWDAMIDSINNDEKIKGIVEENCIKTLAKIVFWMKEGCPVETNKFFRPKKILDNEIWDPDKYGNIILIKRADLCEAVNNLLKKMEDAYSESFLD